jgi:hypothetical protein
MGSVNRELVSSGSRYPGIYKRARIWSDEGSAGGWAKLIKIEIAEVGD